MFEQLGLFPNAHSSPNGLVYTDEFITPDEEQKLIKDIASLPLQPFQFGQFEGKRRVAWFGYKYDYAKHQLEVAEPFPNWLNAFVARVEEFSANNLRIDQILCTEYDSGVGIGWHKDKPHFERIFGISLGSNCNFRFRRSVNGKWERYSQKVRPRSIYSMSGPSRHIWEHSIPPVEARRYSITLRTMTDKALARSSS